MKLLLDQNISFRLVKRIEHLFPGSEQVKKLQLENKNDLAIWRYARENDFAILTFDIDFADLNTLYGSPPKILLTKLLRALRKLFIKNLMSYTNI